MKIPTRALQLSLLTSLMIAPLSAQITRGGGKYYSFNDRKPVTQIEKTIARLLPTMLPTTRTTAAK